MHMHRNWHMQKKSLGNAGQYFRLFLQEITLVITKPNPYFHLVNFCHKYVLIETKIANGVFFYFLTSQ
jgi:hypothetical protein